MFSTKQDSVSHKPIAHQYWVQRFAGLIKELSMRKTGMTISALLFSLTLILPALSFAHEGEQGQSPDHGQGSGEHQKFEEGSGSSALESSSEGKEYGEDKEEGSFFYRRHREEMKHQKAMEEGMGKPAATGSSEKMKEGSGKR